MTYDQWLLSGPGGPYDDDDIWPNDEGITQEMIMPDEAEQRGEHRHFRRSESIASLAAALAQAQGKVMGADKSSVNPFFKSKYADLASVIEAIREPFSKSGIAFSQFPRATDGGIEVETLLVHSSGEWMSEILALPVAKADAQGIGSAITYAKRYALQAIAGVPSEDDDGNAAAKSTSAIREQGMKILTPAAQKGTPALELAWKTISREMRSACVDDLAGLKAEAAKAVHSREPGEETDADS